MGWTRVRELSVEKSKDVADECSLWSRGGLEGVEVHIDDNVIQIPRDAILELVASEFVSKQIARLEEMDTEQAVALMMREYR
jgi:hypothetical protein